MKYDIISLHFTNRCNLNCPFCYKEKKSSKVKPQKFFIDMIPYLAQLTPQVALGGGEPFLYPKFIKRFAKECKEYNLICNVTTNGTQPIKPYIKDVDMVSISLDEYKVKLKSFSKAINYLKDYKHKLGCNLLINNKILDSLSFITMVNNLLYNKVDRVFVLYPKHYGFVDVLKSRGQFMLLTTVHKNFYVDDTIKSILTNRRYSDWDTPCHYGSSIISINEQGSVTGCSFSREILLHLDKSEDILKMKDLNVERRYSCPYIQL